MGLERRWCFVHPCELELRHRSLDNEQQVLYGDPMSKVIGVRLSDEEKIRIEKAMKLSTCLGERGGVSGWVRRVALAEATRLLTTGKRK
jgi:hypothetical protein